MNKLVAYSIPAFVAAAFCIAAHAGDLKAESPTHEDASTDVDPVLEKLDRNKDGAVDREEAKGLKGLSETFAVADTNKDGKLNRAELSKLMAPTPQPERPAPERR